MATSEGTQPNRSSCVSSDTADNRKPDPISGAPSDPGEMAFWQIVRAMTVKQVLAAVAFMVGLFSSGYAIAEWTSAARFDALTVKLDAAREEAKQVAEQSARLIEVADLDARAFRAKAEFLNRYASYLLDPSADGTMHKLFVDHVCLLWRETQREILELQSKSLSLDQIKGAGPISPRVLEILAAAGISEQVVADYRDLDSRRSIIQRRANRSTIDKFAFTQLQNLEKQIRAGIDRAPTTKVVTFFDNTSYEIPLPVATDVHFRPDCKP